MATDIITKTADKIMDLWMKIDIEELHYLITKAYKKATRNMGTAPASYWKPNQIIGNFINVKSDLRMVPGQSKSGLSYR